MNRSKSLIAAAALFLFLAGSGDVQAQWPGAWAGWGQGWYLAPYRDQLQKLPYYALFPPVYYSHPIRYTYGCSPFARLPGFCDDGGQCCAAAADRAEPLVVRNPYVNQREFAATSETRSSVAPLVLRNPYVDQPAERDSADEGPSVASAPVAQLSPAPRVLMPSR